LFNFVRVKCSFISKGGKKMLSVYACTILLSALAFIVGEQYGYEQRDKEKKEIGKAIDELIEKVKDV